MDYCNEGYRYAVGWNPFMLNFIGAWPQSSNGIFKYKIWFCFFCVLMFIWIPLTASIYPLWGNMDAVIGCLSISIPLIIAMMKLVIFYYYKKEVKIFIDLIAKDWTITRKDNERIPMIKMAYLSRVISFISVFLINSTIIAYFLFKIWMAMQIKKQRINHDSNVVIDLLYPAYLPYSTKELKYYLPTWAIQCFTTYFSTTAYASFDSFMSMILLHICGQLAIIGISIKNLVNETNFENIYKFRWSLGQIVKRHEELNQLIELMENSFCSILLPQMLVCTLAFCFQGYMLTMNLVDSANNNMSILEIMFFSSYMIYTILHLFIYCYIGDLLSFQSTLITQTCYESNWFNLPFREARLLMIINYRSYKPLAITAGKFCSFSRHLFIVILKTSFGYLSMLLAVKQ
ncbi:odorant receptor 33b-like isoform X1 [Microplitis mediator]|uniref:odorant receptor 33b-like isoform X1 n=1 Tax=Microplitis mediator TaxID=375433 RepID=UPI0025564D56|nr:odorant receptor 33b-like isoform X1 [Microplitis mediator]XP_057329427.1 odorant receptor 33b-like isoform X1 [Microplitis mediator]